MSPEQIELVQGTFARLGSRFGLFVDLFYYRLFALDPSTRELFSNDMRLQKHALTSMLQTMVEDLGSEKDLVPLVSQLGARHVRYGVRDEDYNTVGEALAWALQQALDDAFDAEARDAWRLAYWKFATIMRGATVARTNETSISTE